MATMRTDKAISDALDPGIRLTVEWLNREGFVTTDSGDGVSKPDMECALAFPNVFIEVPGPSDLVREARRIHGLLASIDIGQQGPDEGQPSIQATYDPGDESAIIALYGVDDAVLASGEARLVFDWMRPLRARANAAVMGGEETAQ